MVNLQSYLYEHFNKNRESVFNFVQWLAQSHELNQEINVLDIGCGPGGLLKDYAQLGWHITGLEPDPDFYTAASEVAAQHSNIQVQKGGFQDIQHEEAYDLILAVNDPFAYLLEISQRLDALRRVFRALRPGGVFFLEVKNFFYKLLYHEPITQEELELEGKQVIHVMQHEVDFHTACWIHRDEYIIEGQPEVITKTHRVAMISPSELLFFLEQQGFENIQTYNSYEARSSQPLTENKIMISAVKPMTAKRMPVADFVPAHGVSDVIVVNIEA